MKVKELIAQLESFNDLEAEVVVGGLPIYSAEKLPGYYDGCYQILIQDKSSKFYNIKGMEITRKGTKIELHTFSIEDIINNCETLQELENVIFKYDNNLHSIQKQYFEEKIKLLKENFIKELK